MPSTRLCAGGYVLTEPLAGEQTLQMLNLHLQYNHDHGGVVQGHQAGGGMFLKIEKSPSLSWCLVFRLP